MKSSVGLRAKTGRAVAVVLAGPTERPDLVWRGETPLVDGSIPLTSGPYHGVIDLPWSEAELAVAGLVEAIQAVSDRAVSDLSDRMRARGVEINAAGVVGSPPRNLAKIGNGHIRAHAAEGILFRRVLETSAKRLRMRCSAFTEKELRDASSILGTPSRLESALKEMGRAAGPPWRADERLAATAAWIALARRSR